MIHRIRLFYTLHNLDLCDRRTANDEYFYGYTYIRGLLLTLDKLQITNKSLDGDQLFSNMYYNWKPQWGQ